MEGRYVFTVSEMNQFIKELLDNVPPLQEVLLRGEISNYKVYPSGHHYFTLKDSQSSLKCVGCRSSPPGGSACIRETERISCTAPG